MAILSAAVVAVGCLCLFDLLLTFAVLRRLREHAGLLARADLHERIPAPGVAPGERPADFAAVSISGQELTGPDTFRVAAFFSASCSVCPEKVAPFVDYAQSRHLDSDNVLAVVVAEGEAPYTTQLSQAAQVCVEPPGGALSAAFAVAGFPAFFLLDSAGTVAAAGFDPQTLPEPAAV
jgi:hypothetical protein